MNEEIKGILNAGGIDTDEWLERTTLSERLLLKSLKKFLSDASYADYKSKVGAGDMEGARKAMHTLEGLTGGLSMAPLTKACLSAHAALKENNSPDAEAERELSEQYANTTQAIAKALEIMGE